MQRGATAYKNGYSVFILQCKGDKLKYKKDKQKKNGFCEKPNRIEKALVRPLEGSRLSRPGPGASLASVWEAPGVAVV